MFSLILSTDMHAVEPVYSSSKLIKALYLDLVNTVKMSNLA